MILIVWNRSWSDGIVSSHGNGFLRTGRGSYILDVVCDDGVMAELASNLNRRQHDNFH